MMTWNAIKFIADNLETGRQGRVERRGARGDGLRLLRRRHGVLQRRAGHRAFDGASARARYDIAHGVANALLLPFVMEYNKPAALKKFGDIARRDGR